MFHIINYLLLELWTIICLTSSYLNPTLKKKKVSLYPRSALLIP